MQSLRVLLLQASDVAILDRDGGLLRIFADGGAALLDTVTEAVAVVEAKMTVVRAMSETTDGSVVDLQFAGSLLAEDGLRIFAAQRTT